MELNYKDIGKRIRKYRKDNEWSQSVLAEKAGIEPSNLSHIERAATKLSLPTLVSIANALEVSLDELAYGSLIKNSHISIKMVDNEISDCSPQELSAIVEIVKTTKSILRK